MTAFETLLIHDEDGVRVLTINRPKVLNALSPAVIAELGAAIADTAAAARRGQVRALH